MNTHDLEVIVSCFEYRDGQLIWRARPQDHFKNTSAWGAFNARCPGKVAGRRNQGGYYELALRVNGRLMRLKVHSVVWALHHREWPVMLDHIDRNPSNNRIENLRLTDKAANNKNRLAARVDSTTGLIGVLRGQHGTFSAHISVNGKRVYLGRFKSAEKAHEVYMQAKRKHHPEAFAKEAA